MTTIESPLRVVPPTWVPVFDALAALFDVPSTVVTQRSYSTAADDTSTQTTQVAADHPVINTLIDHLDAPVVDAPPPVAHELMVLWAVLDRLTNDDRIQIPIIELTKVGWKSANRRRGAPRQFNVTLQYSIDGIGFDVDIVDADRLVTETGQIERWQVVAPPGVGKWAASSITEAVITAVAAICIHTATREPAQP